MEKNDNNERKRSRRGRPLDLDMYKRTFDFPHQVLSVWWDDDPLESLTIPQITKRLNRKFRDERYDEWSTDAVNEKVNKLVEVGLLFKTTDNRYKPVILNEKKNRYAPAFIIRNRDFSGFFSFAFNPCEYLHYYGCREKECDIKGGVPQGIFPHIQQLGDTIRLAVQDFCKKTGKNPKLVSYINYGMNPSDLLSYVNARLQYEFINLTYNNLDHISIDEEWFENILGEDIDHIAVEILREAEINHVLNSQVIKNKQKVISYLKKCQPYSVSYIADQYAIPIEEFELLIKREAEKLYNKPQTKKSTKDNQ